MGWKGALRSISAANRRANRAAVRYRNELERQQKHADKLAQRARDALEVAEFENYLEVLRSVHRDCGPEIDWQGYRDRAEPAAPAPGRAHEDQASRALAAYKPGLLDRLLGRVERRTRDLEAAVEQARVADRAADALARARHDEEHADWLELRELAERILAGDREAELEAVDQLDPFSELSELGSEIAFEVPDRGPIVVRIRVNGEHVIPQHSKSLLQSGKLSVKKMPRGQFFELYQDYVCSCVLRVAREMFALLPIDAMIVTAEGDLLNTASGHVERQPIVSVAIPRRTLAGLNVDTIDPSDSLRNFKHRMDFKKTKGFLPIREITPSEVSLVG